MIASFPESCASLESLVHQMTGWRDGETEGAGLSVI